MKKEKKMWKCGNEEIWKYRHAKCRNVEIKQC